MTCYFEEGEEEEKEKKEKKEEGCGGFYGIWKLLVDVDNTVILNPSEQSFFFKI